jgi:hypothetical protein
LVPLVSFVEPANVYEGNLLCPMIHNTQKDLSLRIDIAVADMGYISSDHKKELRNQFQTAVITRVRENMLAAEEYRDYGCPECPEGIPLIWDGYDPETETHRYIAPRDQAACKLCRLQDSCYQEVSIRPPIDEHRFGIIPLHTTLAQRLLQQIRPQVERGFENDKNKLSLNRFFANGLEMAKILGHLADACQILLLFAEMKTNTKAKAKRVMKAAYTQLSLNL